MNLNGKSLAISSSFRAIFLVKSFISVAKYITCSHLTIIEREKKEKKSKHLIRTWMLSLQNKCYTQMLTQLSTYAFNFPIQSLCTILIEKKKWPICLRVFLSLHVFFSSYIIRCCFSFVNRWNFQAKLNQTIFGVNKQYSPFSCSLAVIYSELCDYFFACKSR